MSNLSASLYIEIKAGTTMILSSVVLNKLLGFRAFGLGFKGREMGRRWESALAQTWI